MSNRVSTSQRYRWSKKEDDLLRKLRNKGKNYKEIAKVMPQRTVPAITQRCSYLQKYETKQKKRKNNDEGNHRNNKKQKVYKIRLNTSPKNAREVVMAYREV